MKKKIFSTIRKAEELAKKKIRLGTFNWLNSAAEDGLTAKKNINDLNNIKIIPKILTKNYNLSLKQKIFNTNLDSPLVLCPMGHQTQFEKNGEISTAIGSSNEKILSFFSTQGRTGFHQIRKKVPKSNMIWQIFPFGDKKWIEKEIRRAEKNNSLAICFCFDAPVRSHRYLDKEKNYDARKYGKILFPISPNPNLALKYDWEFIKWVKKKTKLKIIPKGLVNIQDINTCSKMGITNIWISNHGGRMFNSGISTVDVLKKIQHLRGKNNIIVDGGVRRGSDILKYLCLGANLVGVGRPVMYGLICNGSKGVSKIFEILKSELNTAMYNGGFRSLKDMKFNRLII